MISRTNTQTKKKYAVCQSCGSPFSKNSNNYLRITSGFYDIKFCTDCFQNDQFTEPKLTMEQMRQKLVDKLRAMGMPGNLDRFTDRLQTLERWRSA